MDYKRQTAEAVSPKERIGNFNEFHIPLPREEQQKQKHNQTLQNIHDESVKRKSEDVYRTKEMVSAVNRDIRNAEKKEEDSKSWDAFMDRNRRLLDKGIESVKRERNKTYFS